MTFLVPSKRRHNGVATYWDPFRDLDRFFGRELTERSETSSFLAPVDVEADDAHIFVKAELPGLKKDDIDVNYHDGVLTISGEKKSERRENAEAYRVEEISYGTFSRQLTVGDIDFDKASADYRDGILNLTLPKAESQQAKRLEIK